MRAFLATVPAVVLLVGCQSYQSHGYDVASAREKDVAKVKHALRAIAAQTHLPKRSPAPYEYSPAPIAVYGDSRVQLLASRHKDYVHIAVTWYDFSAASDFARVDRLVRGTLASTFGDLFSAEPHSKPSKVIVTY
jgi:hypothetical protein